jgi:hypothetical protein
MLTRHTTVTAPPAHDHHCPVIDTKYKTIGTGQKFKQIITDIPDVARGASKGQEYGNIVLKVHENGLCCDGETIYLHRPLSGGQHRWHGAHFPQKCTTRMPLVPMPARAYSSSMCGTNGIPLGCSLHLLGGTVHSVQTLKVWHEQKSVRRL